ncbi:MAG: hypothetical protein HY248_04550 [Fimbriimonas ginsengisoli]|nr:hypothetical protein [Fimbriimonas ginsengisoli]
MSRPARLAAVLFAFLLTGAAYAQSGSANVTVVSSATYGAVVAPDSIITIFGSGMASTTASATLDANGQLPTDLGGISVEINGRLAALLYVSPSQINLVAPATTEAGTASVVVHLKAGAFLRGSVQVAAVAPGVFVSGGVRADEGAILDAQTFRREPFQCTPGPRPASSAWTR